MERLKAWKRTGVRRVYFAGIVVAFAVGARGKAVAQDTSPLTPPPTTRPQTGTQRTSPLDTPPPPYGAPNPLHLEKLREEERHKRLVADTAKLVELTNELKADVEKAGKNELSVDVVKKAAEIEKLARDVKDRMRS